jgi:peptidoglycan/LPS O-acetylase OafA/YrhL
VITAGFFLRPGVQALNVTPRLATILEVFAVAIVLLSPGLTYVFYLRFMPSAPPAPLLWIERSGSSPLYALEIFIFAFERGPISRRLRHPALVLLGEISFATYLVHHIPLRWLMANTWTYAVLPLGLAFAIYLVVNIPASWLVWRFIESPARASLYRRLTTRRGGSIEMAARGNL